jgi:hypothetical protein
VEASNHGNLTPTKITPKPTSKQYMRTHTDAIRTRVKRVTHTFQMPSFSNCVIGIGVRLPTEARFPLLQSLDRSCGPSSLNPTGTKHYFPDNKATRMLRWPFISIQYRCQECVELYLHSATVLLASGLIKHRAKFTFTAPPFRLQSTWCNPKVPEIWMPRENRL